MSISNAKHDFYHRIPKMGLEHKCASFGLTCAILVNDHNFVHRTRIKVIQKAFES